MRRKNRKVYSSDIVVLLFTVCLMGFVVWFGIYLWQSGQSEKKIYQSFVALDHMEYNEEFRKEAQKLPGLRGMIPVMEIPVRLRAENYTANVILTGLDLSKLTMKVSESNEVFLGNTPVLLLGENSLMTMVDHNGHGISEQKQKEMLNEYKEIEWQYCFVGETGDDFENWKPCVIGGILSYPSEDIYIFYEQAQQIMGTVGRERDITKILLTIQGRENYEKVLSYFEGQQKE
ncbi:MAG: hypothetical protein K2M46_01540 [Lachnospiraceae bacterium]|nr:hypothetical protein [Lachnospiraceae bacterium]